MGKILGPQGSTIKRLQEDTGAKISVLGKGSMRDKNKVKKKKKLLIVLVLTDDLPMGDLNILGPLRILDKHAQGGKMITVTCHLFE